MILALGGSIGTPAGGLEAEIAHFDTFDDLKAAASGSLAGKIAFVSNKIPRLRNGGGYMEGVSVRALGAIEAAKRGAIGLLINSIGTDNNRYAHTGGMRYEDGATKIPAAALITTAG